MSEAGKPEFTDSDRQWFDALSGQPAGEHSQAAREGFALRTALESQVRERDAARQAAAPDDATMDEKLRRLLAQADTQKVFDRPTPAGPATPASKVIEFPWWRRRRSLVALAASVVIGVVVIDQWAGRPDYPEPPITAGIGGVQQIDAESPRAAAESFAARLRESGLRPGLYQRRRVYVVDITLLASELPAAKAAFATLGLQPQPGSNRIEIAPRR